MPHMKPKASNESLPCFQDARGLVVEPLGPDELPLQHNAHLVITAAGGVRGNHFHRRGTEVFLVIGPAKVRLRDEDGVRDVDVGDGVAMRFRIPPGVAHAIQNTGTQPMLLLAFNTEAHDPAAPDFVREVLIPT